MVSRSRQLFVCSSLYWLYARFLILGWRNSTVLGTLKVFIMAGQSNMAGHGHANHLNELITTTGYAEYTKYWNYKTGNFSFRSDVFLVENGLKYGNLTVGFGDVPPRGQMFFGPEIGFGGSMGDFYDTDQDLVLLIKYSWGGLSLAGDFRPPSSGGSEGWAWNAMLNVTHFTLRHLRLYVPGYSRRMSYDIVGFIWFQGEADAYVPSRMAEYRTNLINFIQDFRDHISSPNLPFIIGEMGGQGAYPSDEEFTMRETQRNVTSSVPNTRLAPTAFLVNYNVTETFDADYHYYGRADVYIRIGRSFARNMLVLLGNVSAPTVAPSAYPIKPTIRSSSPPTTKPTRSPTPSVKEPANQPPTTCKDFLNQTFYNFIAKVNTTCSWLKSHPQSVVSLCRINTNLTSSPPPSARKVCPATCDACNSTTTKPPTRKPTSPLAPNRRKPTQRPTPSPQRKPTPKIPTRKPSRIPTHKPFRIPTRKPSRMPTRKPSRIPTSQPSQIPTSQPSYLPTIAPSQLPVKRSRKPKVRQTLLPTILTGPTLIPSQHVTLSPTQPSTTP